MTGSQWLTPWSFDRGQTWARYGQEILAGEVAIGKGRIILLGAYLGETYFKKRARGLEDFLKMICVRAGFCRKTEVIADRKGDVYFLEGASNGKRMFFVFCESKCKTVTLKTSGDSLRPQTLTDLISGKTARGIKHKNGALAFKFNVPKERMLALMEVENH